MIVLLFSSPDDFLIRCADDLLAQLYTVPEDRFFVDCDLPKVYFSTEVDKRDESGMG